jgi:LemA family
VQQPGATSGVLRLGVARQRCAAQAAARFDPESVETVKGYAAHEKGTFKNIAKFRSQAMQATTPADKAVAENQLTGAIGISSLRALPFCISCARSVDNPAAHGIKSHPPKKMLGKNPPQSRARRAFF